jgi:hypothetical protein
MNGIEAPWLWLLPVAGLLFLLLVWWFYGLGREIQAERARESFRLQFERLEKQFLEKAAASGLPRGLRWVSVAFAADTEFVRDRHTGKIVALVPVTVEFEALEGSDMEGLPAVPLPRQGSAVLTFVRHEWTTAGRVLFNLAPSEVVERFPAEFAQLHRRGLR